MKLEHEYISDYGWNKNRNHPTNYAEAEDLCFSCNSVAFLSSCSAEVQLFFIDRGNVIAIDTTAAFLRRKTTGCVCHSK